MNFRDSKLTQLFSAGLFAAALMLSAGCGDSPDSSIVTGTDEELAALNAQIEKNQQSFGESMAESYKNDPAR